MILFIIIEIIMQLNTEEIIDSILSDHFPMDSMVWIKSKPRGFSPKEEKKMIIFIEIMELIDYIKIKKLKGVKSNILQNTTKIINQKNIHIKTFGYMFYMLKNLSYVNISNIIIEDFMASNMFAKCENLKYITLDIKIRYIKNIIYMFRECRNLKYINLQFFNKINIINLTYFINIFYNCKSLRYINLSNIICDNRLINFNQLNKLILVKCKLYYKKHINIYSQYKYIMLLKCIIK